MRELASAWLKYEHALEAYAIFAGAERLFLDSEPKPFQFKQDDVQDGEWTLVRLNVVREPPIDLSLLAGDIASNLRAALDHAICGLSAAKTKRNAFPIFDQKADYTPKTRENYLDGVEDRFREIVDRHQPFASTGKRHPLSYLAWFNNADKHAVTHPCATRPENLLITTNPPGRSVEWRAPTIDGVVTDGFELCRFRRTDANPNFKVRTTVSFSVGFGERAIDGSGFRWIAEDIAGILGEFKRWEHPIRRGRPPSLPPPAKVERRFLGGPIDGQTREVDPRIGGIEPAGQVPGHYILTRAHPQNSDVQYDRDRGFFDPDRPADLFYLWANTNWVDPRMPRHNIRLVLTDAGEIVG
jgi:hypothetical protein